MQNVFTYLESLGFSEIEAKIYATLLKSGSVTVAQLAEKTKINRTAAYTHIASLMEKGIVLEQRKGSRKHLAAIEPEKLHYLIDNKRDEITLLERQFPFMVKTINETLTKGQNEEKGDIKYYKGRNGLNLIFEDAFKSTQLYVYANLTESANFFLPRNFSLFEDALNVHKQLKIYEIISDSPKAVEQYNIERSAKSGRYFYKFMPKNIGLTSATFIYAHKVAILNITDEISGIILQNKNYYNNSKKLFDFIWQMLPESKIQT